MVPREGVADGGDCQSEFKTQPKTAAACLLPHGFPEG